jgi:hypothetical protein
MRRSGLIAWNCNPVGQAFYHDHSISQCGRQKAQDQKRFERERAKTGLDGIKIAVIKTLFHPMPKHPFKECGYCLKRI